MNIKNQAILAIVGLSGLVVIGALLPVNADEESDLLEIIDALEEENLELSLEVQELENEKKADFERYTDTWLQKRNYQYALEFLFENVDDAALVEQARTIAHQEILS